MKTLSLPDTFCGDCTPKFSHAALYPTGRPDPHLGTSRGRVEILGAGTPNQNVRYLVCADIADPQGVDHLCIGGAGDDDRAYLWTGMKWIALVDRDAHSVKTYGLSACAFGPYGLYVSCPGIFDNVKMFDPLTGKQTGAYTKPIGSRGIAAVEGFGPEGVFPQDEWYGQFGLGEYVITGGFAIGQGTVHDGLMVHNLGYVIEHGLCQFNRVHRSGAQFAIASWLDKPEGHTEFFWPVNDFSALAL